MSKEYRGVFPALVAPQDENNEILWDVMAEMAKQQIADGASGFLVNGHTGEHMMLHVSLETRKACAPLPAVAERIAGIAAAHAALGRPEGAGRAVGQGR